MNYEYQKIINFLARIRRRKKLVTFLEKLLLSVVVTVSLVSVLALFDYWFAFSVVLRIRIFNFIIIPGISLLLFYLSSILLQKLSFEQVSILVQRKYTELRDDLVNAVQLGKKKTEVVQFYSIDMVDALILQTVEKTRNIQPQRIIGSQNLRKFGLMFIVSIMFWSLFFVIPPKPFYYSFPRIIYPYNKTNVEFVKVYPGNITLPRGGNLEILAELGQSSKIKPVLKYRFGSDKWERVVMEMTQWKKFRYTFTTLNEEMQYRVQWKDTISPTYQVKIITPPELGDIQLEYFYPAYTQLPSQRVEHSNGDIEGLLGTRVKVVVTVDKPLRKAKMLFADGQTMSADIRNNTVSTEIYMVKDNKYWFEVEDENGYINLNPTQYSIRITPDEYPKISFLSPTDDLVVSEKNKLKLTFESNDDYGVKEINLVYNILNTGAKQLVNIKRYQPPENHKIEDYDWDLDKLNLKPGDKIEYYLEVIDNDLVSGPKKSVSNILRLEIFSYEQEHQKIENELAEFREELLSILGKQMEARELTKRIPNVTPNEQNLLWNELLNKQNTVKEDMRKTNAKLDKLLDRMNDDPLQDERVFQEYKQINNNLDYLQNQPLQEAMEQIGQKQVKQTLQSQDEIVSSLEKMILLAEDVLEYQRMYDLMSSAQEANDLSNELTKNLDNIKPGDAKKMQELNDTLNKISKMMEKISQSLTKQQENLPEEFVNQEAIKQINLAETQDMLQQLSSALNQGNMDKALEYAKKLMQELNDMLKTIQTAAKDSVYNEMSSVDNEMKKYSQQLDELIKDQNSLIDKTEPYEKKRLQEYLKQQESLLKRLAEMQKQVLENTQNLSNNRIPKIVYSEIKTILVWQINQALPKMRTVYDELNTQRLQTATTTLAEIILHLQNAVVPSVKLIEPKKFDWAKQLAELRSKIDKGELNIEEITKREKEYSDSTGYTEVCLNELTDIKQQEEKILDELRNFTQKMSQIFTDKELQELQSFAEEQSKLRQRTTQFNQSLQELSRKTASLEAPIFNNLRQAGNAMGEATETLKQGQTHNALDKEKEAMYYLTQGKDGLQNAMDQMQQMGKKAGKPMAGFVQRRGGMMGVHNGFVQLPGKEDYLPAKELRQEVLEGLKEKYPKLYESLIKEYYKRLTE